MRSENKSSEILNLAVQGLEAWERKKTSLDDYIDRYIGSNPLRKSSASILFEYFRHKALIDAMLAKHLKKKTDPRLLNLLRAVSTQIHFQSGIAAESAVNVAVEAAKAYGKKPAGFVNAVLRKIKDFNIEALKKGISPLPSAIRKRWLESFNAEKVKELEKLLGLQAEFTFRATGVSPSDLSEINAEKMSLPEWTDCFTFYKCGDLSPLFEKRLAEKGQVYIQDPATALAPGLPEASQEPLAVLDICGAPGGKSIMLKEKLPNAEITVSDISFSRQKMTLQNFESRELPGMLICASGAKPPFKNESFDLILADVPCSNTGVFRRRPDCLWRFSPKHLEELVKIQSEILRSCASLVKKEGRIIYSTCSLEKEENTQQLDIFLSENPGFELEKKKLIIPGENHDGAFAALLRKI